MHSKWQHITGELRNRPGKWAKVDTVTSVESVAIDDVEPGEFEATLRRSDDGLSYDIYARYVGQERTETR